MTCSFDLRKPNHWMVLICWNSYGRGDTSYINMVRECDVTGDVGTARSPPSPPSSRIYQDAHQFYIRRRWTSHQGKMSVPGTPGGSVCSILPHKESENPQSFHRSVTWQKNPSCSQTVAGIRTTGGSVKTQITGSTVSDSGGLGWGSRICISSKHPDTANAAGPWPSLWEPVNQITISRPNMYKVKKLYLIFYDCSFGICIL